MHEKNRKLMLNAFAIVMSLYRHTIDGSQRAKVENENVISRMSTVYCYSYGPLNRYAKLRFAHAPGMPTSKETAS